MDILNERMHNPILEALFIELSPIDSCGCILRNVMDTTTRVSHWCQREAGSSPYVEK